MSRFRLSLNPRRTVLALRAVALSAVALSALPAAAQRQPVVAAPGASDGRPTIAVLYFTNGALVGNADYAPLSKGMAEMMITELARNPGVRVVERDRLQQLIEEQNLGSGNRVDKETAVQLGKILGAHHMLMGSFVIDPKHKMRIDVRSVNVETSQIEYVETVEGKDEDLLPKITELGSKVNAGLKLPQLAMRVPVVKSNAAVASGANQFRAAMLMSRALEQQDRGNKAAATTLYKDALAANPDFEVAKMRLASIETGTGRPTP